MSCPKRVSIPVSGTKYHLEVDVSKWDCNKEPPHCHVASGRQRYAQVWLSNCRYKEEPKEISANDSKRILDAVSYNRYELQSAYEHNAKHGAD